MHYAASAVEAITRCVKEVRVKEELKTTQLRSMVDANERFDDDGGRQQRADHPDARRSRLRGIIARIERQMPVAIRCSRRGTS